MPHRPGPFLKKQFLPFFMALLAGGAAQATPASPIQLAPIQGDKSPDIQETKSISGTCGRATINITGVTGLVSNFFTVDGLSDSVIIRGNGGKTLTLIDQNTFGQDSPPADFNEHVLSDYNGVACTMYNSQPVLLVWSICSGSSCGDAFSFFVFSLDAPAMIEPPSPTEMCNADCASQFLGNDLPERVQNQK